MVGTGWNTTQQKWKKCMNCGRPTLKALCLSCWKQFQKEGYWRRKKC